MIIAATLDAGTRAAWPLVSILPPLGALTTAPSTARAHVNAVLAEWQMGPVSDVAALVASELTTNALRASTTPAGDASYVSGRMALIWMCLMSDRSRLLIEVHDQADGAPVMKDASPPEPPTSTSPGRTLSACRAALHRSVRPPKPACFCPCDSANGSGRGPSGGSRSRD